ncbi:MAG TPA: hypothetical protein VHX18_12310 [Rhizomicrobium sp.]|jgi:hypothetical protein|nr:hypothetical protein [Rhizomicrobium sp.]
MRIPTSLIIAGATVIGLAGLAPTLARELDTHTVTVRVPGGGVETIEYTGKIAPTVSFQRIPVSGPVDGSFVAFAPIGFPSFTALDRISAEMDQQMNAMMHQAQMLVAMPQNQSLYNATLNGVPQGATSFSIVSETSSNGVCTHVTRITQAAGDAKPQMVSQTSGDCGQGAHSAAPATDPGMKQIDYRAPAAHPVARAAL